MNLDDLRLFVYVAKSGSFSKASRMLDIPASTIARRILQFEQALSESLLVRTTKGLELTTAGNSIWNKSSGTIFDLDGLVSQLHHDVAQQPGTITIAAPHEFSAGVIAPMLKPFLARHPQIKINFRTEESTAKTDYSSKTFYEDSVDLAFRFGPQKDSSLIARRLQSIRLSLFASQSYLLERGMPDKPNQLLKHDFLGYSWAKKLELEHSSGAVFSMPLLPKIQSAGPKVLIGAVEAGMGILPLSPFWYEELISEKRFVEVLPGWTTPWFNLYLVYVNNSLQPRCLEALIDFFCENWQEKNF